SAIYRVRDSLLTGGWLVMSKGPKKMATGIYSSAEYQALSHDEWAKLHPGLCNVEWMPTNAPTSQPVPRAGLTGPTGGTNPVPRAGHNLMLNLNLKELEYPVSDTEGEPNTDQPLPVASRRITSVSASPGTNPNTTEPHPLPENFQSDESNIRYAKKQGLNLEEELTLFMELHGSNGNERRNWQKVFRKWLIDAAPPRGHVVDLPDWLPVKE